MAGSRRRGRLGAAGFTLFEVLAAVAVLGLVYTVLARSAIQGLQAEGVADRMLHASLLADTALSEVELSFASGEPLPPGVEEKEEDIFRIEVELRPYDLEGALQAVRPPPDDGSAPSSPPVAQLLRAEGQSSPLIEIEVHVRWNEGVHEREVSRLGFVFDPTPVGVILEGLAVQDGSAPDTEPDEADPS